MASVAPGRAPLTITSAQWVFLLLLVLSISINYIDRGSLAVASDMLTKELRLDTNQLGWLFASFFVTYAGLQMGAGWLVDKYNVNIVYAVGFFIWSVAMLGTGFVRTFGALLAFRLLLGAGEAVAYPSYSKILSSNFREQQRGLANALIDVGSKTGPALGVLLGGLFMDQFGWRIFFIGMGTLSLIWLVPWLIWAPRDVPGAAQLRGPVPSIRRILKQKCAWGTFFGLVSGNYVWYFVVFWIPPYLRMERHYSQHDMALFGSVPFWGVALSSLAGGWLSDRWIATGANPVKVRRTFVASGLALSTLMLPAVMVQDAKISMLLLTLACLSLGLFTSNVWALTQTLAGPAASGRWTGIQNAIGNIPGVLASGFTGWVVQRTGEFYYAFVAVTVFLIFGVLSYMILIDKEVDWSDGTGVLARDVPLG